MASYTEDSLVGDYFNTRLDIYCGGCVGRLLSLLILKQLQWRPPVQMNGQLGPYQARVKLAASQMVMACQTTMTTD